MSLFDLFRRNRHYWIGWEPLVEPGISDVDGGAWGRVGVRCRKCGEQREVWGGIDRDDPRLVEGCEGRR